MNPYRAETARSVFRLARFLVCYVLFATAIFQAAPQAAIFLQHQYDALGTMSRLAILALLLLVTIIGLWRAAGLQASVTARRTSGHLRQG